MDDTTPVTSREPLPRAGDADPLGYRAVSAFAVAALIVAAVTALATVGLAISAKVSGRPILNWWVVLAAAIGFGLALVAGRHIRNSDGTLVGLGLASAAWWISLVTGAGYATFLVATDMAVRKQAEDTAGEYVKHLLAGEPEAAFVLTRDVAQQATLKKPVDVDAIRSRFGSNELATFNRGEVARLVRTWGNSVKVDLVGSLDSEQTPNGFKVPLTYLVRSPEGECEMTVSTQGFDDPKAGDRKWMVVFGQTGMHQKAYRRTRLGKLLGELHGAGLRDVPPMWAKLTAADIEPLVRVEGEIPPQPKRTALARELAKPEGMKFYLNDPTKQVFPQTIVRDGTVEVLFTNASTTSEGDGVHTELTVRVKEDRLLNEIRAMSGSNWEKEPVLQSGDESPTLVNYNIKFEPVTVNLRPKLPRDAPPSVMGR